MFELEDWRTKAQGKHTLLTWYLLPKVLLLLLIQQCKIILVCMFSVGSGVVRNFSRSFELSNGF